MQETFVRQLAARDNEIARLKDYDSGGNDTPSTTLSKGVTAQSRRA